VLFGLICITVVVMRESRIDSYKPGFRAPFYPWLQISGVLIAMWLISEMGGLAIGFTIALLLGCVLWYRYYASGNLERRGAIFHIHQRLGEQKFEGLERELMTIIHDRTQSENLSYEALVARSAVVDLKHGSFDAESLNELVQSIAAERFDIENRAGEYGDGLAVRDPRPVGEGVYLSLQIMGQVEQPELIVMRFSPQVSLTMDGVEQAHTLLYLVTPDRPVGLDLRLAGHIAEVVQSDNFGERWLAATDEKALNSILMRDDHFYHGPVETMPFLVEQLGRTVGELDLPRSCILAVIDRDGELIIATPEVTLLAFDGVAIIGEPADIQLLNQGLSPRDVRRGALAAARATWE